MNTHDTDGPRLGDRVINAAGWWTPEVIAGGLTISGAVWVTPWLWLGTAAVAVWVATHPRLRQYLTRTTTSARPAGRARLNVADTADESVDDTDARRGWEATG
ncbi:MAG: hypothetical protein GEV04_15590 [Actinophytocola sp.]|nr:hypothetical protein [Actinophytocola sp.]